MDSLPKDEQRRQGLWWELIKSEKEYVRDLATMCQVSVGPGLLRSVLDEAWGVLIIRDSLSRSDIMIRPSFNLKPD